MIKPEHMKAATEDGSDIWRNGPLTQQVRDKAVQPGLPTGIQPLLADEPAIQIIQMFHQEIHLVRQRLKRGFFKRFAWLMECGTRQHGIAEGQLLIGPRHCLPHRGERRMERSATSVIAGICHQRRGLLGDG